MQPDPKVFLPAIRRQMLRGDLFGKALEEGLSQLTMLRAGEGMAQLALRCGELPSILRKLRRSQRTLLKRTVSLLTSSGLSLPEAVPTALAHRSPRGAPSEEDIETYELLVSAISAGIAALSVHPNPPPDLDRTLNSLCKSASRFEARVRTEYREALARLKAEIDALPSGTEDTAHEMTDTRLTAYLRGKFPALAGIEARNLRHFPGDNAQEIFFFELNNHPDWPGEMVLRLTADFNPTMGSIADESELLNHLHAEGIPVPRIMAAERDTTALGSEFSIMERVSGKAELPDNLGERGRPAALAMARVLAAIHRLDASKLPGKYRYHGQPFSELMTTLIDRFHGHWVAERIETSLAIECGYSWLRSNVGRIEDRVTLVHGDDNFRNILIDGSKVTALLDWELAHLGHPGEDLAYIRPDVEKLIPWSEFVDEYLAAGGSPVSDQVLDFFNVWSNLWRSSMASWVYSGYITGKHSKFVYATVAFHENYAGLDLLSAFMAEHAY